MRYYDMFELERKYLMIRPTIESAKNLITWIHESKIQNPVTEEDLHATVISWTGRLPILPVKLDTMLDPQYYEFDLFGEAKSILVLKFRNKLIESRHTHLRKYYEIPYEFPTFLPHITLSYSVENVDLNQLILPIFPIRLYQEYIELELPN